MTRTGRPKVKKIAVECAGCGAVLYRYPSVAKNNTSGRYFCSKACQHRVGSKPRKKQNVICLVCGKAFYPISGSKGMYCSKACHDTGQTRRVTRSCAVCGASFELRPSQVATQAGRYCSKECEGRSRWQRPLDRMHNGKPALLSRDGYVKIWEPMHARYAKASGWVMEHRVVMEQILGRSLAAGEHIHHINGDKTDNRPENLAIMSPGEHSSLTGYERAAKERAHREAVEAELERYRRLYGPLPPEGT